MGSHKSIATKFLGGQVVARKQAITKPGLWTHSFSFWELKENDLIVL